MFCVVVSWPKIHKRIILPKQSWPYGALVEAKRWLAACCSWVEDVLLQISWPSVGWAALAWRGGSSWWCQRKSCPSLCLSFVGTTFSCSKQKNKKRNRGRRFAVQWLLTRGLVAEQPEQPWRCNSQPCDSEGAEVINTLKTQGCFSWNSGENMFCLLRALAWDF